MKIKREKLSDEWEKTTGTIDIEELKDTDPEIHEMLMKSYDVCNAPIAYLKSLKHFQDKFKDKDAIIDEDFLRLCVVLKKNDYLLKEAHKRMSGFMNTVEAVLQRYGINIPIVVHEEPEIDSSSSEMH